MKKILFLLAVILIFSQQPASAHSKLESSNPEAGATETEPLKEISLTFNTRIEESSTFTLSREGGEEVQVDNITIDDDTLRGTIPQDLENGAYTVSWDIVGADTHVIKDSINFTVQLPDQLEEKTEEAPADEEPKADEPEGEEKKDTETASENNTESQNSQILLPVIGGILLVAVIVIAVISMRKKR
ncbi:hypothetical protein GKZ89_13535 [Bacillus mangrovi]|uniref:CopC domain-containing protein n=1 Tax=Metabacillus mangrovi TaxID=1491830 RepID=A0A7X2V5G2_9BACI|nr:copper resistance CopC family protein [Metabacillus mangrovi]MTH54420.1 hypothetical protein [Metabacillus mangrovi]